MNFYYTYVIAAGKRSPPFSVEAKDLGHALQELAAQISDAVEIRVWRTAAEAPMQRSKQERKRERSRSVPQSQRQEGLRGERGPSAKLSVADVAQIGALKGVQPQHRSTESKGARDGRRRAI